MSITNEMPNKSSDSSNSENIANKTQSLTSQLTVYNLATGAIFQTKACNKITDMILIICFAMYVLIV